MYNTNIHRAYTAYYYDLINNCMNISLKKDKFCENRFFRDEQKKQKHKFKQKHTHTQLRS